MRKRLFSNLTDELKEESTGSSQSVGSTGSDGKASVANVAGDAVGLPVWYVAVVNNNTEKSVAARLESLGYESFVAKQEVLRVWRNGRKAKVDRILIPTMVFVRCTEADRQQIVRLPYVNRFLSDKARASQGRVSPPAVIPEREIVTLRFMLGQSDHSVDMIQRSYSAGDRVRVIRGALQGLEGEVIDGGSMIVRLDILGTAKVTIDIADLISV